MGLEKYGSKPELMDVPGQDWVAQNFTSKEWDPKGGKDGKGGPKRKVGLPNQAEADAAYRSNYDKIDWSAKNGGHQSGPVQDAQSRDDVDEPAA